MCGVGACLGLFLWDWYRDGDCCFGVVGVVECERVVDGGGAVAQFE